MSTSRTLVIVRHGEAEQFAPSDIERPLSDQGRRDAAALGRWLRAAGVQPDVAYVSGAVRTRETWSELSAAAGWTVSPFVDSVLYGTDESGVLELVQATLDRLHTAVVIGHNPAVGILAQMLDDGSGAATGSVETYGFPTATAAVLEVDGEWVDVAATTARLQAFEVARDEG